MQPINLGRVVLAGLLCGLIINVGEYLLNGVLLASQWEEVSRSLNRPPTFTATQIALFNVWGFIAGIGSVWIYAAILPRFGAGPKTAVCAGLVMWFTGWLLGSATLPITDWVPLGMWITIMVWGIVEVVVATVAGAKFYRESNA